MHQIIQDISNEIIQEQQGKGPLDRPDTIDRITRYLEDNAPFIAEHIYPAIEQQMANTRIYTTANLKQYYDTIFKRGAR
jgi:hypothetical protein